jgi:RNA polymerase sigma-70 factor (ECF subfamily)
LLQRVQAHDQAAWSRLVKLYGPLVYGWCRQAGAQPADAADIGQEVFQTVALKIQGFHHHQRGDTFRGWLHAVTRNKLQAFHSRRQVEPSGAGGSDAYRGLLLLPDPGADEAAQEESELCHRALELIRLEFEEKSWQAFWRVAVEGEPPIDVAHDLQITVNAVYIAKCRILCHLRQEFAPLLDLPMEEGGEPWPSA